MRVPRQALDRRAPHLPVVGAQALGHAHARVERAVTSSIVAMTPAIASPSRSGPSVTRCCMRSKVRRGLARRAGDQVVVERRRQDLHLAGREHLLEAREQAARGQIGDELGKRPAARSPAAIPVSASSQPSQVRTTRSRIDRQDADR